MAILEIVMKKLVLLIAVLNIFAISTLHSQWLEKEGYWELEQNYGQLRDIKLNESTNELWIVSADNKVIAIDAEIGLEIKRCECELDRAAVGAKISSDFLSIGISSVFERDNPYSPENIYDTLYYDYFSISDCSKMFNHNVGLNHLVSQGVINGIEFSFFDYNTELQNLIISFKINNKYYNGPNDINDEYGFTKQFTFFENQLNLVNSIDKSFSNVKYHENRTSFFSTSTISHSQSWSNWGGGWNFSRHNSIYEYDIMNKTISTLFNHIYDENSDGDRRGHNIRISKILENGNNKFLTLSQKTLYEFTKNDTWFNDSLKFVYDVSDFLVTQNNEYVLVSTNKSVEAYNFNKKKIIESYKLPSPASSIILDSHKKNLLLYCADNKIRYITPDILKPIPDLGFIFDKALAHTGEKIQFNAICNIDSCEYEWQFLPAGIKTKTKSKEIEYKYNQTGTYDVKLTIITPDGERHEFLKEKIIKVIDKPKADFSYVILNEELPLKVQFTDLSKGELIERFWDFGDGNTSAELNPIHEYKFPGDFSVKLIVKDSLDSDTLIMYEEIIIGTPKSELQISINSILSKHNKSEFKNAYLVTGGFIYTSYYYEISTRMRNDVLYDYSNRLIFNHFDLNFLSIKKDTLNCGTNEVPFFPKPTSLEVQLNDYLFAIDAKFWEDTYKMIYDSKINKMDVLKEPHYPYPWIKALILKSPAKDNIFSIFDSNNKSEIIVFDFNYDVKSELTLPIANNIFYLADTIDNGLNLFLQKQNKSYLFYSISSENKITYENSILINTAITISGIKSVHENLILLHGFYNDKANKTTYAYFAKYHPLDNTLNDTILYSRKDILKIERVSNSLYAAIGQSRGRQGYLLLDTNLHQIRDIRVDSLTGEIKDMLINDNKVYLFTEKIVSLPTMALGDKESYQTTASVLGLPEDIIASVEDSPIIFTDKLTHSAYPNPTNEVLNLKVATNESANYTIKLYDIFGTERLNIHDGFIPANTEKIFSISTSALSIGSYYYVISGGGNVDRGKVMVVR